MKVSMPIDPVANVVGEKQALQYVKKAGFDYFDYDFSLRMVNYCYATGSTKYCYHPLAHDGYLSYIRDIKKYADDLEIGCNQIHAPFPVANQVVRDTLKKAIECTAELGGKICVIHPDNFKCAEDNAEMYLELLPFAKSCGVKIATENMWNWVADGVVCPAACSDEKDFLAHLKAVNDKDFIACVDVGHAELIGLNTSAEKLITALGDYVQALHIHDVDFHHDLHERPFTQKVDFVKVVKALKKINYKGVFSLEVEKPYQTATPETVYQVVKKDYLAVRRLADMFEAE